MRKNSVRKFIHAILDLLPLLIIPIFALNILHKETEPISIEVQQEVYYQSNAVETYNDLKVGNIYKYTDHISNSVPYSNTRIYVDVDLFLEQFPQYNNYDIRYISLLSNSAIYYNIYTNNTTISYNVNAIESYFIITELTDISSINEVLLAHIQYTDYKYSKGVQSVTYSETDIGSQFIYALYKPVNDYFNFNNLFNMGAIYNWIELNLFSGTAPLPIFIIWNVIVYEFFVDLIFLLYGVFMFVIDFATSMIDRFMYKSKRGI